MVIKINIVVLKSISFFTISIYINFMNNTLFRTNFRGFETICLLMTAIYYDRFTETTDI